jgi:HD domain-containing protein
VNFGRSGRHLISVPILLPKTSGLASARYCGDVDMEEVRALAADLLSEALPRRWAHVQGVADRAQRAASMYEEREGRLVVAAALLHDVGYSSKIARTGFHPLDGARYLRSLGVERRLVALVAHHSCAYREAELRGLSAELAEWMDEETPLRDALWWADMTTSPDGRPVGFDERIKEIQDRYGPQDLVTFFIRQAEPELRGAVERTEARLQAAGISYE